MTTQNDLYNHWIEALESGKYPKSTSHLRTYKGYCCLGVACDLVNSDAWEYHETGKYFSARFNEDYAYISYLPGDVKDLLHLHSDDGYFEITDLSPELQDEIRATLDIHLRGDVCLAGVNDLVDDFDLIIKILKERPPSLFAGPEDNENYDTA